ncbi:hypothetical protein TMatcc_009071 [Talaromyces marneffei ATCC 18224]
MYTSYYYVVVRSGYYRLGIIYRRLRVIVAGSNASSSSSSSSSLISVNPALAVRAAFRRTAPVELACDAKFSVVCCVDFAPPRPPRLVDDAPAVTDDGAGEPAFLLRLFDAVVVVLAAGFLAVVVDFLPRDCWTKRACESSSSETIASGSSMESSTMTTSSSSSSSDTTVFLPLPPRDAVPDLVVAVAVAAVALFLVVVAAPRPPRPLPLPRPDGAALSVPSSATSSSIGSPPSLSE